MDVSACLAIVIGYLSVANAEDPFCSGALCFIRPDPNAGKSWMAAQQMCKDNNATLPIADTPNSRMSFIDALNHFGLNGDVWLGATASDNGPDSWRWLDGSQYNRSDVQQRGAYTKSYAYVAKITSEVLAYAYPPNTGYSYICQCKTINPDACTNGAGETAFVMESQCFKRYDEKLSWFNARNKCLSNSCDLASILQLSLLDGMVDSSGFWVGLRTSQWNWQNAVTGLSSDVTITSWSIGQPDDAAPHCMATNSGDFPSWKDISCAVVYPYICQVSDIRPSTATTTSARSISTRSTTSATTTKSALGPPGSARTDTSATTSATTPMSPLGTTGPEGADAGSANVPLAIGLGVGLGVPVITVIVVVVVVVIAIVLRRKPQNRRLGRDDANIEPEIANSKQASASSPNSVLQTVKSDANDHYQQLKNSHELQEQQQYEELQQSPQYEQLQRRNELQEQQQYEQLPQAPQYEQL